MYCILTWFGIEFHTLYYLQVVETVRLPLIDPYFLYDCVASFSAMTLNPECVKLIEEAKSYHLLPDRNTEILNKRMKQRDYANILQVSTDYEPTLCGILNEFIL